MTLPSHHRPDGGFRNPWPTGELRTWADLRRWRRERRGLRHPPIPSDALAAARPDVASPRGGPNEVRITWIGHSTFLIQAGALNLLTDPVWSQRVSPVSWAGPSRLVPPAVSFADLPPLDAVLISHDHYDHLDAPTIRRITRAHRSHVSFVAPLGHAAWLRRRGADRVHELDWWQATNLSAARAGEVTITAVPVQHWTRRTPFSINNRLWAGFVIDAGPAGRIYFGGDSGWCTAFAETGRRMGPFDVSLLPIGGYEPRWFMKSAHMGPEEAVQAWQELGGRGQFVPMHWGTFILTDEPPLEPPARLRDAWLEAGCEASGLSILRHGETLTLQRGAAP